MSKESRIDEQIRHFYDHVPDVDDAFPLKEYLLKHEDSRMAWYLLGKQYEGRGDGARATYCFAQAGEIYEAFESKPAPALPQPTAKPEKPLRKYRGPLLLLGSVVALLAAAIVLLQIFVPDEEMADADPAADVPAGWTSSVRLPADSDNPGDKPGRSVLPADGWPDYVAGASEPADYATLGRLLAPEAVNATKLLVAAPRLDDWSDWVGSGKPVAAVGSAPDDGYASIDWFDAAWCGCKPQDGAAAERLLRGWKENQEGKLVLRSAFVRFRELTGKWPQAPEELAGDYPANTMAGWLEAMTPWFEELAAELNDPRDGKLPAVSGWPGTDGRGLPQDGAGLPAGRLAPLTEQPLEIIVDKKNHRLAVVSGDVILRNYKVGLGGGKTPEGKFVITEKVRNPNGRTDGPFGSRGMTLSGSDYAIHGTDEPDSMGKDQSLGCVRMLKADLEELYDLVTLGTPVTIAQGGLPDKQRVPEERFRLDGAQDETNPHKVYNWLG